MKNAGDRNLAYYLNLKYPVQIVECDEGGYFVKIPDLPGCLTQGETIEEALKNIKEAKELWLESAFEDKAEIPLPADERGYSGKFIVRLPVSLHERLALAAEREGVSLNQHVATLLAERNALKNVERLMLRRASGNASQASLKPEPSDQYRVADAPRKRRQT
jgi:predicted RNase H-like HicB family nuclease